MHYDEPTTEPEPQYQLVAAYGYEQDNPCHLMRRFGDDGDWVVLAQCSQTEYAHELLEALTGPEVENRPGRAFTSEAGTTWLSARQLLLAFAPVAEALLGQPPDTDKRVKAMASWLALVGLEQVPSLVVGMPGAFLEYLAVIGVLNRSKHATDGATWYRPVDR